MQHWSSEKFNNEVNSPTWKKMRWWKVILLFTISTVLSISCWKSAILTASTLPLTVTAAYPTAIHALMSCMLLEMRSSSVKRSRSCRIFWTSTKFLLYLLRFEILDAVEPLFELLFFTPCFCSTAIVGKVDPKTNIRHVRVEGHHMTSFSFNGMTMQTAKTCLWKQQVKR